MHTNCNLCGSSDANAVYPDGNFCFSCRSPNGRRISPYVVRPERHENLSMALPDDVSRNYPEHVLSWTSKYHLTVEELIKHDVFYSPSRDQLIFTWWADKLHDNNNINGGRSLHTGGHESKLGQARMEPVLWQARNFNKAAKAKCYTKGKPEECIPIYWLQDGMGRSPGTSNVSGTLVLVEDPVSAIKISRFSHSMPVLGSDLSLQKIKHIAGSLGTLLGLSVDGEPVQVIVWLDGNMYHKAQRIADRFKLLGVNARAAYSALDPKEYDNEFLYRTIAG